MPLLHSIERLIAKYNANIPRYTSFPTVPDWKNGVDKETWGTLFAQYAQGTISLYIHIPFCHKLCTFCACNKMVTNNYENSIRYISALEEEILCYQKLIGFEKISVSQLHIGGGTPTFLRPKELNTLMQMLYKYFIFEAGAEKSIEAHPEFTTNEQITELQSHGFNRISFGVQDFTPQVQKIVNRVQSYENICQLVEFSRKCGFDSVNLDFIYGLPLQNENSIIKIIEGVKNLMPDRIAYYGYAHVPWKDGTLQRKFSDADLPTPQDRMNMFTQGKQGFEQLGYGAIGMDHFAQKHDALFQSYTNGTLHRNFMGYTVKKSEALLGLGVSAISELPLAYKQNTKNISKYYENTQEIETSHLLTEEESKAKQKIIEIMTSFQTKVENLTPNMELMVQDGLLEYTNSTIYATNLGKIFVRNIAFEFDIHRLQKEFGKFSKSV